MTVEEALQQLIDTLDEQSALAVLDFVRVLADDQQIFRDGDQEVAAPPPPLEWMKIGRPTSEDDPLWNIVGMVGEEDNGPTDIARNHDRYLAELYADLHGDVEDEEVDEELPLFTLDDPIWRLVGMGRTEEPTNIARDKDDMIADAVDIH